MFAHNIISRLKICIPTITSGGISVCSVTGYVLEIAALNYEDLQGKRFYISSYIAIKQ